MAVPNMVEIRLIAAFLATGMSQTDVAKILGITQGAVSAKLKRDVGGIQQIVEQYKAQIENEISQVFIKGDA